MYPSVVLSMDVERSVEVLPSESVDKQVRDYAASGLTEAEVCVLCHMDELTPELHLCYMEGKCEGKAEVAKSLYDKCRAGNMTAISLYLKCNGWAESSRYDIASLAYDSPEVTVDDLVNQLKNSCETSEKPAEKPVQVNIQDFLGDDE